VADLIARAGIRDFLLEHTAMALKASTGDEVRIEGLYHFTARWQETQITEAYELAIDVPASFPSDIPRVEETGGRIPRQPGFHVNPDGSLCLGSPLRLRLIARRTPDLQSFANACLVPYLFAVSHRVMHGGDLIFGELAHGHRGELEDYGVLFGLKTPSETIAALKCLGLRRRVANKRPCPCRCGSRLGRCCFHQQLLHFRPLASRAWFRSRLRAAGAL
jgi:hypothetical protein